MQRLTQKTTSNGLKQSRPKLTAKQLSVLRYVFAGHSSQQTAEALSLQKRTVEFHLYRIYKVLGAHNRMQARASAERMGLLPLIEPGRADPS